MSREIILHNDSNLPSRDGAYLPELITEAGERAGAKFVEFFLNHIANVNTRKAYGRAVYQFFAWCADRDLTMETITPLVAGGYIRTHPASDATVKQHLAALRTLYDWFVVEQVAEFNPFSSVRGPKLSRREGSTPALSADEVRDLLGAIDTTTIVGLRDRALITAMLYTFGRVSAVVNMKVRDYSPAGGRRMMLHLREKGGKRHKVPAHHKLQEYIDAYVEAAGIAEEKAAPLFRPVDCAGRLKETPLRRQRAWEMVRRRARAAGIAKDISPHSMRATGITNFLENKGQLEAAQRIAAHADPRTTKLYDRRGEKIDQGEIEKIRF